MEIYEKLFGREQELVSDTYNTLGVVYDIKKDYTKALSCYNDALAIRKKIFGEESSQVAESFFNIALVYNKCGDYRKSLEYSQKARSIFEKTLGPDNPTTKSAGRVLEETKQKLDVQQSQKTKQKDKKNNT